MGLFSLLHDLGNRALEYYKPPRLMACFFWDLPKAIYNHPLTLFTSPKTFQDAWFATTWKRIGPGMASNPVKQEVISSILLQPSNTHGNILELGSGGGDQLHEFIPLLQSGKIKRFYAVEPNEVLHPKLHQEALRVGFTDDNFIILKAGGDPSTLMPALRDAGLLTPDNKIPDGGVFDTIIAVEVLCSFSRTSLEDILTVSQALLTPSGKFVFYNHMMAEGTDRLTRIYAWCVMWVYTPIVGGCRLDCKFEAIAREMKSGWKEKRVEELEASVFSYSLYRQAYGWLTKA